jgi:hypothetical protein
MQCGTADGRNRTAETEVALLRRVVAPRGGQTYVWRLPDETPGTLEEIFAAEDSRAQNLVLYEIRKVDGFRRSCEAIDAKVDPYDLILAVMTCIHAHLHPLDRPADRRRRLQLNAKRARTAMTAEEFLAALDNPFRDAWLWRLKDSGFEYPADPRIITDLRNLAIGLEDMLTRGALKETGGRPSMAAFKRLIQELARVFECATGRRAAVTRAHNGDEPYKGVSGISSKSSARSLPQSLSLPERG